MKLNKLRRPGDTSGNVNVCCGMHPSGRRAEYIECLQNGAHTQPGTHSPDAQTMTYPNIRYALERITWASTAVQVRWNIQPFAHIYFSLLNYTTSMAVFRIIFFSSLLFIPYISWVKNRRFSPIVPVTFPLRKS